MNNQIKKQIEKHIADIEHAIQNPEIIDMWEIFTTVNAVYGKTVDGITDLFESAALSGGLLNRNLNAVKEVLQSYIINNYELYDEKKAMQTHSDKEPVIFLSHSSADSKYGNALRDYIIGLGIKNEQLIYTSHPQHKIPLDANIFDYLRSNINQKIFMIILWSNDYMESPACLCEMGAAWLIQCDYTNVFVPSFNFKNPKFQECAVDTQRMGAVLNGDRSCKAKMIELKDKITSLFNLTVLETTTLFLIDTFIEAIIEH